MTRFTPLSYAATTASNGKKIYNFKNILLGNILGNLNELSLLTRNEMKRVFYVEITFQKYIYIVYFFFINKYIDKKVFDFDKVNVLQRSNLYIY